MKLYTSHTSPFGRKVRVVLLEKKIEFQWIEEQPNTPGSLIASLNPLGKVPALLLDDGKPLYDSSVIVDYLDQVSPVARLIPAEHRQAIGVKRWEALADGIVDAAVLAFLERRRPAAKQSEEWITRQLEKVDRGLFMLSADLSDRKWCFGGHFSLADIAVGCCLGYLNLRMPALGWADRHPNLAVLFEQLNQRPSFQETQPPVG
ncbi:glutathione S-transferase [Andreprevotia chitinilytica]|uniref:glutathione S-transferase n=1 Tax=Andreprevotia chitinilytica TaxID=396808 RepID=UPI0005504FB4|nr:glutathione S-transferase [Andreprevotia chitinilytica]